MSHFIVQVSDSFTENDLLNLYYDPDEDGDLDLAVELGTYSPSDPSNPGMPGVITNGLKFADHFAEEKIMDMVV